LLNTGLAFARPEGSNVDGFAVFRLVLLARRRKPWPSPQ
jgi:hypothetical protein